MCCPIPYCHAVGWFTSAANYARHFREVHQSVANYFECLLQPDHYRAKRSSDLRRHLGSAHPQLSTGSVSDLTNRCRTRQLPNRSFVDSKGYTFAHRPLTGRPEVRLTTAEAHADPFCDPPSLPVGLLEPLVPTFSSTSTTSSAVMALTSRSGSEAAVAVATPGTRSFYADLGNPMGWIPSQMSEIPDFLLWVSWFQEEFERV